MKKIMLAFLALVIFNCSMGLAIAKETVNASVKISSLAQYAPDWDEFCPPEYINAKYVPLPKLLVAPIEPIAPSDFWTIFLYPLPSAKQRRYLKDLKQYNKDFAQYTKDAEQNKKDYNSAILGNYWTQRRKSFDGEVKLCLANERTALACFMQVRQMEDYKTTQINNQQAQAAQFAAQIAQQASQQVQQASQFAAQQALQSSRMIMQTVTNAQNQFQAQQQAQQLNNNINNLNTNLNNSLNTSNSNLHAINHNLNRINQTLRH